MKPEDPGNNSPTVVDKHHGRVDDSGSNDRQKHVASKLDPANVIVGKRHNENVLGVTSHGQSGSNVGSSSQRQEVGKRVGDLVADAKVDDDTGEDKHDRIVHDSGRSDGRHGHDLGRALPVDGIVQRVTELVKETSTFHLLNVDRGKHETKEQEERLHDNNLLSIEVRTMSSLLKDETPDNHGETTTESDTGTSDRKEPVGEHEEDPEGKVDERNRPLSEGTRSRQRRQRGRSLRGNGGDDECTP